MQEHGVRLGLPQRSGIHPQSCWNEPEKNFKTRVFALGAIHINPALMVSDYGIHHGQTQADVIFPFFCRKKGIKDAGDQIRGDSRTCIGYGQRHEFARPRVAVCLTIRFTYCDLSTTVLTFPVFLSAFSEDQRGYPWSSISGFPPNQNSTSTRGAKIALSSPQNSAVNLAPKIHPSTSVPASGSS